MLSARPLAPLLLLALLSGCGASTGSTTSPATSQPALDRPAVFDTAEITWAQETTLHYGEKTFELPAPITRLRATRYGFYLGLEEPDRRTRTVFFDGQSLTPVPGNPGVSISPDGELAGWISRTGPEGKGGRLAEVVVIEIRTGKVLLRNSEDMGRGSDDLDDLYEELPLVFHGFDRDHVYWTTPDGDIPRRRASLTTWEITPAATPEDASGMRRNIGEPYDSALGRDITLGPDGRISSDGGTPGLVSPDGRWCAALGDTELPTIHECASGREVSPAWPEPAARFGAWAGPTSFLALARPLEPSPTYEGPDPSRGSIVRCTLPSGTCTSLAEVSATSTVVFPTGLTRDRY